MKELRTLKGKRKLYIQLLIAFLIFFVAATGFFLHFRKELRQGELERSYVELEMFSEWSKKVVRGVLENSLKDIRAVAEKMALEEMNIQEVERQLKKGAKMISFCYIGITDTKGLAQTTAGIQADVKEEVFFKKAITGISNTSNLLEHPLHSQGEFVNAVPIYQNGVVTGVLYGVIDVSDFSELMKNISQNKQYYFSIVEQDGDFVLNPRKEGTLVSGENFWIDMLETDLLEHDIDNIKMNMGQNENRIMDYLLSGEQRYLHYMPYGKNKWYIVSVMNPEVMNQKLHQINVMVWKLMAEVLAIFAIAFMWVFYLYKKSRDEMLKMNKILEQNETSFAIAVSQGIQVVFDYDIETKQLTFRYKGNEKYGFPRHLENVPECFIQNGWVVPDFVEDVRKVFEKIEEGQQTASCIVKIKRPDEKLVWSKVIITNIFDKNKSKIIQTVGILEDATLLKENELQMAGEMELRKVITSNAIMSYEINITRDYIIEQNFDEMQENDIIQERQSYTKYLYEIIQSTIYEEDRLSTLTNLSRENLFYVFFRGKRDLHLEYRKRVKGQGYIWVECIIHFLQEPESGDVKGLMVVKDINDKKGKELELKKKADMDFLTEVYNRATTEKLVTEIVSQNMEGNDVHAFLICDLDNFKTINDTLGHQVGDKVLIDSAEILKKHFRKTDIVGRLGGDEFIVLMQNVNSFSAIKNTVGRLVTEFDRTYGEGEKAVRTTISIGISLSPIQGSNFVTLYQKADQALYRVKENGRNGFNIFEEEKL